MAYIPTGPASFGGLKTHRFFELVHFMLVAAPQQEGGSMNSTLMPTGASTMLEIIAVTALVAAGFAVWLWRQHRRLQGSTGAGTSAARSR